MRSDSQPAGHSWVWVKLHAALNPWFSPQDVSLRQLESRIWPGRLAIILATSVAYALGHSRAEVGLLLPVGVVYLGAYAMLRLSKLRCPAFCLLLFLLDLVAITVAVVLSGGVESIFLFLYAFPVLVMAILRGTFSGALLATIALAMFASAVGVGQLLGLEAPDTVGLVALLYGLVTLAGVIHSTLQRRESALNELLIALHQGLASIIDDDSIADLLEKTLKLGIRLVGARQGAVALWNEHGEMLNWFASGPDVEIGQVMPLLEAMRSSQQLVRIQATSLHNRTAALGEAPNLDIGLQIPFVALGSWTGGYLFLGKESGQTYTLLDEQVVSMLAARVTTAIIRSRSVDRRLAAYNDLLKMLVAISDTREQAGGGHSERVSRYAQLIGKEVGLGEDELDVVATAGLLHDIGKIGVSDAVLSKPGVLTDDERSIVMMHSQIGEALLANAGPLAQVASLVRGHHERFDGKGYPDGLRGDAIPLGAQIIGMADAIESMLVDRPYRVGMSRASVLEEIRRCTGTQFSPTMAAAAERMLQSEGAVAKIGSDTDGAGAYITISDLNGMVQSARWRLFTKLASEIDVLLDLPELGDRLLSLLCSELEVTGASLATFDGDRDQLRIIAWKGTPVFLHVGDILPRGEGIPWMAIEQEKPVMVTDVTGHPKYAGIATIETGAALYVPLRSSAGIQGMVTLYRPKLHAFDAHEMAYLEALAVPIAELLTISQLHAETRRMAITDPLTGAGSRRLGFDRLREACARSARSSKACAVMMLDLDGFKGINDRYGHQVGDEVLRGSVLQLRQELRTGDTLARYGGDEFLVILEDTSAADVLALVNRVSCGGYGRRIRVSDQIFELPCWSAGYAIWSEDGTDPDELIRVADARLYFQKDAHRAARTSPPPA